MYIGKDMTIYSRMMYIILLCIGILFSVLLGVILYDRESQEIKLEFQKDVDDKVSFLEREIFLDIEILYSIKGLYDSSEEVTSQEFKKIAKSILARHKDIQALEWIPKVEVTQRSVYEKKRLSEFPDFEIIERSASGHMIRAKQRDVYYPVYFVEPYIGNETALGFDLSSSPTRHKTLLKAIDNGELLATRSITLVQESSNQKGFLLFIPIYDGIPSTVQKRRLKIKGFVLGVFRIGDMLSSAIKKSSAKGIYLSLVDITDDLNDILYTNHPKNGDYSKSNPFLYEKSLSFFAGRQWSFNALPTSGYISEHRTVLPYVSSLIGTVFVLLGGIYTFIIIRRKELIEETVKERTKELNEANNKLELLSRTDSLTELANRRYFNDYLDLEWNRAIREKIPISLLMIDIDYFKFFNDNYGHIQGDRCLKEVAKELKDSLNRSIDFVARYGGEEFVLVLPNTLNAEIVAQRCQKNIESLEIPHEYSKVSKYVTVSIGLTTMIPSLELSKTQLIMQADKALYQAKEKGRNQICIL